jgi:hypothetical protein
MAAARPAAPRINKRVMESSFDKWVGPLNGLRRLAFPHPDEAQISIGC